MHQSQNEKSLTVIANDPDYRRVDLFSLVLFSAGIEHFLERQENNWILLVAQDDGLRALYELQQYAAESRNWPPVKEKVEKIRQEYLPTLPIMAMMIGFFAYTGSWNIDNPWFSLGAVSRDAILHSGEWWRVVTALTLHADPSHLFGNVLIGGMLVHFLCRTVSSGVGWTLVLLSGILGNYCNIYWRVTEHLSVGFSTAVFGAVGVMSTVSMRSSGVRNVVLPLGAGAGLLAFLGTSGQRTDLGAHFWGFAWGAVFGLLLSRFPLQKFSRLKWVRFLPVFWTFFIIFCWMLARHSLS